MDLIARLVFLGSLLSVAFFPVAGSGAEPPLCQRTATVVPHHAVEVANALRIEVESFVVPVPKGPERTLLGGGELTLVYADGAVLVLGTGPLPPGGVSGRAAAEIPALIFGANLCSVSNSSDPVRSLAAMLKPKYFEAAHHVTMSRLGKLVYYLSDSHWQGFSGRAFVTSERYPNLYLQIDAKGMDFDRFQRIVLGVRAD